MRSRGHLAELTTFSKGLKVLSDKVVLLKSTHSKLVDEEPRKERGTCFHLICVSGKFSNV